MASIFSYFWNSRPENGASHTTSISAEDEDWVVVDDSEAISVDPSFSPTLSNLADDSLQVSEPPQEPIKEISDLPPQDLSPPVQEGENPQIPKEATSNDETQQTIESLPELNYFVNEFPSAIRGYQEDFVYHIRVIDSDSDSDDDIDVEQNWGMISTRSDLIADIIIGEKNTPRAGQLIASKQTFNSVRKSYRKSIQKKSRVSNYSKPPLIVGKNKSTPLTYQRGSKGRAKEANRRS